MLKKNKFNKTSFIFYLSMRIIPSNEITEKKYMKTSIERAKILKNFVKVDYFTEKNYAFVVSDPKSGSTHSVIFLEIRILLGIGHAIVNGMLSKELKEFIARTSSLLIFTCKNKKFFLNKVFIKLKLS